MSAAVLQPSRAATTSWGDKQTAEVGGTGAVLGFWYHLHAKCEQLRRLLCIVCSFLHQLPHALWGTGRRAGSGQPQAVCAFACAMFLLPDWWSSGMWRVIHPACTPQSLPPMMMLSSLQLSKQKGETLLMNEKGSGGTPSTLLCPQNGKEKLVTVGREEDQEGDIPVHLSTSTQHCPDASIKG